MVHIKLKQILRCAVDDDIILRNPCDRCKHLSQGHRKRVRASPKDRPRCGCGYSTRPGDNDTRTVAVRIGLATGMRRGEVLGLTWEHVDLETGDVQVVQQFATHGGMRKPKSKARYTTGASSSTSCATRRPPCLSPTVWTSRPYKRG